MEILQPKVKDTYMKVLSNIILSSGGATVHCPREAIEAEMEVVESHVWRVLIPNDCVKRV